MATVRSKPDAARAAGATARTALVVAGMHRSGTSAMARMLSLAGAALPPRVIAPGADNPAGFWEPADMVGLNDRILASIGSRWDDVFGHRVGPAVWERRAEHLDEARAFVADSYGEAKTAVLKDPRSSLMIRFWDEALRAEGRRPVYVIMVRHPLEVAASIVARGDASEATAVMAWAACMLAVERDTRGLDRLFVDYDDLLEDWRGVLDRVRVASAGALPEMTAAAEKNVDDYLSTDHRHHRAGEAELAARGDLWSGALTTLSWMRSAARGTEPDTTQLDDALIELERLARLTGPALRDLRMEAAAFPKVRAELAETKAENAALRDLANRFHAEADHNGRHWEASREMVAHLTRELALARTEADGFRAEAAAVLPARREIGLAEARALRQQTQNRELVEALEDERRLAANARTERAAVQARMDALEAELAQARHAQTAAIEAARIELAARLAQATADLAERDRRLADGGEREARLADRIAALESDRAALLASPSWTLTRPLRVVAKRLRGGARRGRASP